MIFKVDNASGTFGLEKYLRLIDKLLFFFLLISFFFNLGFVPKNSVKSPSEILRGELFFSKKVILDI